VSAFLQFIWKTDVVESWIADKETQVRSEDYGRDLSSVQTLLTKQVSLEIYELPPFTNCKGSILSKTPKSL
jgi:phage terminase Nu1 subunit (DNA packaging protein)